MDINKLSSDSSLYLALLDTQAEIKKKYPLGTGHVQTIADRKIFLEMLDKHGFALIKKPVDESLASIILDKNEDNFFGR